LTLDQGHDWSRFSSQEDLTWSCRSCAIAQRVADRDVRRGVSYVDEDVVVISGSDVVGPVVIPRQHVGGLEELSVAHRAHVLATLRRLTQSVRELHPGAEVRVVVLTDLTISTGHVCFQLVSSRSEDPPAPL
jgi:diadenosine tetraphosphate (Ap4A) HIT family hydrolase